MPASQTSVWLGYLAGTYPGKLGHILSPGDRRGPWPFLPYVLDNGRFIATTQNKPWQPEAFLGHVAWSMEAKHKPLWCVVPDVVGDAKATLAEWHQWEPMMRERWPDLPLAFAAQDGHAPRDVPASADVVFIGGSTRWKRRNIWRFCEAFPRVHVGRINTEKWLWECHKAGAESCDGSGWFRGDQRQFRGLLRYLERSSVGPEQLELWEVKL